ncbi:MAG: hypothetical protein LBU15_01185 [Rickettsiales bacterium]|jgi:hypothetical protein|nr:hypothetical protein [Rickettsiales bacterium]
MEGGNNGQHVSLTIDGVTYSGVVTKSTASGWNGTLTSRFDSLDLKDGKFKDDCLVGAVLNTPGVSYSGGIENGKYHGYGELSYRDGKKLYKKGIFSHGSFSGGEVNMRDPHDKYDIYKGKYSVADGIQGYGRITYKDGHSLEGEFKNGKARNVILEYEDVDEGSNIITIFTHLIYDENEDIVSVRKLEKEPDRYENREIVFKNLDKVKNPPMAVPTNPDVVTYKDGETNITYEDGSTYVGKVNKKGIPDGKGIWKNSEGELRKGRFKNGEFKEGTVEMKLSSSVTYTGGYKNGKFDGEGELMGADNKSLKKGTFENGKLKNGEVAFDNSDGSCYGGYIKNGKFNGEGTWLGPYGDSCKGEFKDGTIFGGDVKITNPDGSVYSGKYANGMRHGYGTLTYSDGCSLEGEFEKGEARNVVLKRRKLPGGPLTFTHLIYDGNGVMLLRQELEKEPERKEPNDNEFVGKMILENLDRAKNPSMAVPTDPNAVKYKDGETNITYEDGSTYVGKVNKYNIPDGKGIWKNSEGELREGRFKNGKFTEGTVEMKLSSSVTYDGEYKNGKFDGKGELIGVDNKSLARGIFKKGKLKEGEAIVCNPNGSTYEGYIKNGKFNGMGILSNPDGSHKRGTFKNSDFTKGTIREVKPNGSFSDWWYHVRGSSMELEYEKSILESGDIKEQWFDQKETFTQTKEGNYVHRLYDKEELVFELLLPGEPARDEYGRIKIDSKLKPFCRSYVSNDAVKYYLYENENQGRTIEIDFGEINKLLSSRTATDLEGLVAKGAIVVRGENGVESKVSTDEIIKLFTDSARSIAALRATKGAKGFDGGHTPEAWITMLSMMDGKDLRNVRFCTEKTSYSSMTSFLESIGMGKENLEKLEEDYVATWAGTDTKDHAVCFIVDLKKIREVLKKGGDWDSLNTSKETFIHCFDSSRVVGSENYKGSFGAITENLDAINWNLQKEGTCWFHGLAAMMVALENPEIVEMVLDGRIPGYGLSKHRSLEDNDVPNEFVILEMQKLQEIADTLGVNLEGGGFLVEDIVQQTLIERVTTLVEGETLLDDLDKRIEEAFEKFEEKLRDELKVGDSELEDEEYKNYKKETAKEYREKLSEAIENITAEEKAEKSSEFIKNLEKLKAANRQTSDLESRLKAGLEKFKEERGKIVEQTEKEEVVKQTEKEEVVEQTEKEEVVEQTEKKKTEKLNIVKILKNSAKALDKETGSSTIPSSTSPPSNLTCFEGAKMSSPDNGTQPTVKTPEGKAAVPPVSSPSFQSNSLIPDKDRKKSKDNMHMRGKI